VLGKYQNAEDGVEFGFQRYQGQYMPAHKAFLEVNGTANARGLHMVFDDATGIRSVSAESATKADGWYTLDGRKLAGKPTVSGVYVNNGRKVVIK
jgi:hypothetical protein